VVGCCKHGNEPSCFIKCGEFLDWGAVKLLKKDSSLPWHWDWPFLRGPAEWENFQLMTETQPVSGTLRLEQTNTMDKVQANSNVCCLINAQVAHSVRWQGYGPDVWEIMLLSFNDAATHYPYKSSVIKERKSAEQLCDDYSKGKDGNTSNKINIAPVPLRLPRTPHGLDWGSNPGHWGKRPVLNPKIVVRSSGRVFGTSPKRPTGSTAYPFLERRRQNGESRSSGLLLSEKW
jgi:hypothetical protein